MMLFLAFAMASIAMQHYHIYDFNEHWVLTLGLTAYTIVMDIGSRR